jgi:hypothetical protein
LPKRSSCASSTSSPAVGGSLLVGDADMHGIIYLIGLIVVVMAILSFIGLA